MESEMSAEGRPITLDERVSEFVAEFDWCISDADHEDLCELVRRSGDRGYQRGKAEYRNDELFACFIDHVYSNEYGQFFVCACGEEFPGPQEWNAHWRRSAVSPSLPCEWEDLKGLEGRALRERIGARAFNWGRCVGYLQDITKRLLPYSQDRQDNQILTDLIQSKSQACEVEAERLWSTYLDTFEPLLDEPDGAAKIVTALGANYLPVIVDRRAAKRAREAGVGCK